MTSIFVVVETEHGPVKGVHKSSVLGRSFANFQGIPYMKAPLGKLRFRDAETPESWLSPLDVTNEPPAYSHISMMTNKFEGQEDAGIINVFTPYVEPNKLLPVLVWIYGGGYKSGSSKTDLYGPDYILQVSALNNIKAKS